MRYLFLTFALAVFASTTTYARESLARPMMLVPPVKGIALEKTAEHSVIKNLPTAHLGFQAPLILHLVRQADEKACTAAAWNTVMAEERVMKTLRKTRKEFILKHGGYGAVTFAEGNVFAIEQVYDGLDQYLAAKCQYVEKMRLPYDVSLMAVSIDNNVPVVLKSDEHVYVCLGYDDQDIVTADLSKIHGIKMLPGFYMELSHLRKKENLTPEEAQRRERYETALRTGNYYAEFAAPVFAPESLDSAYPHPFLIRFPRDTFTGEMILFGSPKPDVSKL